MFRKAILLLLSSNVVWTILFCSFIFPNWLYFNRSIQSFKCIHYLIVDRSINMDKSWIKINQRWQDRYQSGVEEFLNFAFGSKNESARLPCPCKSCNNLSSCDRETMSNHLLIRGIMSDYDTWVYHGEEYKNDVDVESETQTDDDREFNENLNVMINNLGEGNWGENWKDGRDSSKESYGCGNSSAKINSGMETLRRLLDQTHLPLYDGCNSFSVFSFNVTLLHLKTSNGWTNKSFDALLSVLNKALPKSACVPKNYYEAKKIVRDLGFSAEKIDACINDCVLFRNEYANESQCPKCKEPRYNEKGSNVPQKVLRYFPLKARLQRLFLNEEVVSDMKWHKEKRVQDDNILRHPADSDAWRTLDRLDPSFAGDSRNVRLGLSTDGFNPYGNLNHSYSSWPVFVVPYNLPPWKCMKDPFLFMTLLIPGPKSPGKNIDVYLQPLIDELNELWVGVDAYDITRREKFLLRAALLWTINDFPAYGMLSGWSVKGYHACPVCMDDTSSQYLPCSKKICYMGHRRFLPITDAWRKDKKHFDGSIDKRTPILPKSGREILHDIECSLSDLSDGRKRKRKSRENRSGWNKKSIFFELPYWADLELRHNLDVMHVVKNVAESLIGTVFRVKDKSKDTLKARADLFELGLKSELHLKRQSNEQGSKQGIRLKPPTSKRGDRSKAKTKAGGGKKVRSTDLHLKDAPLASYQLKAHEKEKILKFLESLKFPDGFASNMSRCVNDKELQLSSLKSHDYYIFIQRILPVAIRGSLSKEVRLLFYELSDFIQKLCSRSTYIDVIEKQQKNIIKILCKMERIFPHAFFDVMIHLLMHLSSEARIAGPPQYRWMFPFERKMGTLKGSVGNKAQPEGSIAKRYLDKECLMFCSKYLEDVDTIFNKVERNHELREDQGEISIFCGKGRPIGSPKIHTLSATERAKIHSYILNNCDELEDLINEHKLKLQEENQDSVEKRHTHEFSSWVAQRVSNSPELYEDEIRALSLGPLKNVKCYTGCMVNGYKFLTQTREEGRKTQHSGVVVPGPHGNNMIDYYGVVQDILELEYLGDSNRVLVFKCDWFKLDGPLGFQVDRECGLTSINVSRKWYMDQPYVLASQVRQVFYLDDLKLGKNWVVVQSFAPRAAYDVPENSESVEEEEVHQEEVSQEEVYQEEDQSFSLVVDLNMDVPSLARDSIDDNSLTNDETSDSGQSRSLSEEEDEGDFTASESE